MKFFSKFWKLLLAILLLGAAVYMYFSVYQTEKTAYEAKVQQTQTMISVLQNKIAENLRYKDIQDELNAAKIELQDSRMELYQKFPVDMKEEDQIMYVLYLESLFGTEIFFNFNEATPLNVFGDGSRLMGLLLTVNYKTTYEGYQDMVEYLASDSRLVSVYESTIVYDAARDVATGTVTLCIYLMDSEALEYLPPDVAIPETGKDNIFD